MSQTTWNRAAFDPCSSDSEPGNSDGRTEGARGTDTVPGEERLFAYGRWGARLPELMARYRENQPFPHIHLTDFLEERVAQRLAEEFPAPDEDTWTPFRHYNENKRATTGWEALPPLARRVIEELQSAEFVAWLSRLTGFAGLCPDPSLEGCGLHATDRGGYLNVHTDFLVHHHRPHWRRRVNLVLYLNAGWQEAWGGSLELWDSQMKACVARIPPHLNHAAIFNTTEDAYHGHPEPLRCPEGVQRKSLALSYYTLEEKGNAVPQATHYRSRPGDGLRRQALIWLDTRLVELYSKAKARLGLSDELTGRVLGALSWGKKNGGGA